ncbi:hypothetical protein WNZ15_15555 [Roseibium sp. AS2]|uniref:hypothetical protein n=1 Tax=Roseibium sp. AS2 TaxID=3135781 RepID=UPI003174BBD8
MKTQETERTPTQARQAERGRPVLAVLVASIALVVIGFACLALLQTTGVLPDLGIIESAPGTGATGSQPSQ